MKELDLKLHSATSTSKSVGQFLDSLDADGWIFLRAVAADTKETIPGLLRTLPDFFAAAFEPVARKRKFDCKAGSCLSIDGPDASRATLLCFDTDAGMFSCLTLARKILDSAVFDSKVRHLAIDLTTTGKNAPLLADAFTSALAASLYKFPKYSSPKDKKSPGPEKGEAESLQVTFISERAQTKAVENSSARALTTTHAGTNLVRWLSKRAGNDLTCKSYVEYLKTLAAARKWKFEHIEHDKLTAMKAGAFLAVVKGSDHRDYGIVKLTYAPPKSTKHLVLVGKGLVFDTGGHNLKTSHMFGMHGDMGGSAVAAALIHVATLEKWPIKITAFLAVADNMIGPKSYKPNDVVTAMNGTTIEIVDTDAEGRMVLADTLTLAAKEDGDLMMDFATLTGSCVKAIGTTFSGVFTNQQSLHAALIESGYESGERVWPFPMDKDFADCLDSTSADVKQCRDKGGVDHIEASQLLMKFVPKDLPWVHVDLSACENSGGLAHVPTEETGFGVRFASHFAKKFFKL